MKTQICNLFVTLTLFAALHSSAQGTTAFTYQGQLHDNGTNANGNYTMIFSLYDSVSGGGQIGSTITSSATLANGIFSVNLDFGNVFTNGNACWLDITVTNGGTTQELSPRVQLLPAPYALYSTEAANAANLSSGTWNASVGNYQDNTNIFGIYGGNQLVLGLSTNGILVNGDLQADKLNLGTASIYDDGQGGIYLGGDIAANNLTLNGDTIQFPPSSGAHIDVNSSGDFTFDNNVIITSLGVISLPTPDGQNISLTANGVGNHNISIDGSITVNSITLPMSGGGYTSISADVGGGVYIPAGNFTINQSLYAGAGYFSGGLSVTGSVTVAGAVTAASFNTSSDRNLKEKFTPVNPLEVLNRVASLPISRWDFKTDAGVRHIGPMAQDFYSTFNVGTDDRHIATVDEDGVALAAIQGLNQKLEDEAKAKDAKIGELEKQLSDLETQVKALANQQTEGVK